MNDFAARVGKAPKGAGLGLAAMIAAGGLLYGATNALFTGNLLLTNSYLIKIIKQKLKNLVEGGHRAIIFNRIGGIQPDTIYSEGLHFKVPWFQNPIIYDIRAKPRLIKSPTGSKGTFSILKYRYFLN